MGGSRPRTKLREQMLDSLNYPHRWWITELWGPVGTRYHALHHLFQAFRITILARPSTIASRLAEDSIYHQCERVSLTGAIIDTMAARQPGTARISAESRHRQCLGVLLGERA